MKDFIDKWITSVNWKIGRFSFLPIFFGVMMASLDILMMSIGKITSMRQLPYTTGLSIATLVYMIEPYLFFKALNYESMTTMNLIWDLTSNVMVTLFGVFYFKESIKGLRWLAVLFAIFALILFIYTHD